MKITTILAVAAYAATLINPLLTAVMVVAWALATLLEARTEVAGILAQGTKIGDITIVPDHVVMAYGGGLATYRGIVVGRSTWINGDAVVAHERGHMYHKTPMKLVPAALVANIISLVVASLMPWGWALAWLIVTQISLGATVTWWQRQHEYLADGYAKTVGYGKELAEFLAKLPKQPKVPWYLAAFAPHPPVGERIARLKD